MAELKRVGTQQEALKKAVAEAIASAHDSGQTLFVAPLKNFADPSQPAKAADQQPATPEVTGIQARWTGSAPSPQASDAAAQKKMADGDSRAASLAEPISRAQVHQASAAPPQHGLAAEVTAVPAPGPVFEVPLAPPSKVPAAIVQQGQASEFCALPMDQEETEEKPDQSAEAIAELKDNPAVKDRRGDLSKMQVALGGHDNTGAAAFTPSQYTFGHVPSEPDKRSKEQRKADAKKLAVQRKEDEKLKEKERKWQEEQRRLKVLKAEEEAEEVRQKLLRAQLGPTPTTADAGQAQQQLLLSELKRVGTQQEQLKKVVCAAAAEATARGEAFEISPLKSFKLSDEELANLKGSQFKERLAPSVDAPVKSDANTEAQMQLLFAELKRIEGQQQQLKTAVAQNKVLVVHPPKGFAGPSVEEEYAEEEEAQPNPDKFIPSGGLTGFNVAKDLLKLDFSSPEEAPEEFRAVVFNAPPAKKGMRMPSLTALEIQTQGSFGVIEEKGLKMFLRRLQEDQQDMLELIKDREKARKKGLDEQALPVLKVPAPAVVWDVGTPSSPLQSQGVDASPQVVIPDQQAAATPVETPTQGLTIKKAAKGQAAPLSRFGGAATAAKAGDALPGSVAPTQLVPQGHESRAPPAVFAASPILSQAVTPSQLDAAAQHPPAASNASTDQAAETLFQSLSSTPQAPHASPAETQQSEQVEPSAYSVFAKPTAKANTKAAAKAATKTAAKGESDGDDVELSPEELGFADKAASKQSKHEEKEERERQKQEEKQKKKEAKQQQELQEQLEKQKRKEAKQLKEQQEQEEKQRKKQQKKQEAQREQEEKQHKKDSQAAKGEQQQHSEEEEDVGTEVEAAKGNSVFDAPVPNLAAGVQLGFTPSSAGKSKKKNK
ncbi:MAG: hypothetical protein FRX49_12475 [Trebouxia sp. A1-2]|nr:MAG: hypothetical protein FRX49_12475 [Trebouxia sp. A1-2]